MNFKKSLGSFLVVILLLASSFESPKQKKILIIGDSISIGYTPYVWKYFQGKALVTHNPGNGQNTGTGLAKIDEWIGEEKWDLIQINWGLWDLAYRDSSSTNSGYRDKINGKITFTVSEYAANLEKLILRIQELSDAKLVFVTTTYVPEEEVGRFASDPEKYNAAAKAVMEKYRIPVNDIFEASKTIHAENGLGISDVHYTEKGSMELGKLIVAFIEQELANPSIGVISDEKQVQNLIQDSFDSLFSTFNEQLIPNYYTEDFLLLEQGEIWDNAFIKNYFQQAKLKQPIPIRKNRFEFITTKVEGDRAWVAYHNYATITSAENPPRQLEWLESATAVRTPVGWRLDMLHSTRVVKKN